jgi:hypothetical protein
MFVGYAENCKGVVYQMWNPHTCKVHITQDVILLKWVLFQTPVDGVAVVTIATQDIETIYTNVIIRSRRQPQMNLIGETEIVTVTRTRVQRPIVKSKKIWRLMER